VIRLAFCSNNGGGGNPTLVFHLAHMLADLGRRTLIVDVDPQSSLTAMCVSEERLEDLWSDDPGHPLTLLGGVGPLVGGDEQARKPHVEPLRDGLGLVAGDLGLSRLEERLAEAWSRAVDRDAGSFRVLSAFHRVIDLAAREYAAEIVSINVGPNLGAINRSALLAADFVVTPLAPDPFAVEGLRSLGPSLASWRQDWSERLARRPDPELPLPAGHLAPLGYVLMQAAMRLVRPVYAYDRWLRRVPREYHRSVLRDARVLPTIDDDPWCLGTMWDYPGLALLARDVKKPIFHLRAADGVTGSQTGTLAHCRAEFEALARTLLDRAGLSA
jgi:chromosome partitioning protein